MKESNDRSQNLGIITAPSKERINGILIEGHPELYTKIEVMRRLEISERVGGYNTSTNPSQRALSTPGKERRPLDIQSKVHLVELAEIKRDTSTLKMGVSTFLTC